METWGEVKGEEMKEKKGGGLDSSCLDHEATQSYSFLDGGGGHLQI